MREEEFETALNVYREIKKYEEIEKLLERRAHLMVVSPDSTQSLEINETDVIIEVLNAVKYNKERLKRAFELL